MSLHLKLFKLFIFFWAISTVKTKNYCPLQCVCDVDGRLRRASCVSGNIVDVNVGVPKNVQIYSLNSNSITELRDYCFQEIEYFSLIDLDISNNGIFWIGLHAFAGLGSLKNLNLSKNRIQSFPVDLFLYNTQLEVLDVSGNKFRNLPNEPILQHNNLKVLNLARSQISHIPEKFFTELPNLQQLDLSGNFMVELQLSALQPLNKLNFLHLDDNSWRCDMKFNEVQVWLLKKRVDYNTQCEKKQEKMFEKMMIEPTEKNKHREEEMDIDELWHSDEIENNETKDHVVNETTDLFHPNKIITHFNTNFSSVWTLIIGFQIGLLFGMLTTYCWMAKLCCCRIRCRSTREIRDESRSNDGRDHLLWSTNVNAQTDTPPILRRQISSQGAFCRSHSWEAAPLVTFRPTSTASTSTNATAVENVQRRNAETPPPPYVDCI